MDDCHSSDPEYDDYYDPREYDDDGVSDDGTYVIAEYQERDVLLSDVVPPRTDPNMSSAERVPVDLHPFLPCACEIPATDCHPAVLAILTNNYDDCQDCNLSIHAFDEPDDYELYHDLHGSDGCGEYCVSYGVANADVSSLEEHRGRDVIRIDVIRPQTDSDKSSAALETSVVGAIGTGAPPPPPPVSDWGGGGGGLRGLKRFHS